MRVIKLVFKDNWRQASVAAADCLSVDMCTVADCTLWTLICIHFWFAPKLNYYWWDLFCWPIGVIHFYYQCFFSFCDIFVVEEVTHAAGEPWNWCSDNEHVVRVQWRHDAWCAAKRTRLSSRQSPSDTSSTETLRVYPTSSTRYNCLEYCGDCRWYDDTLWQISMHMIRVGLVVF